MINIKCDIKNTINYLGTVDSNLRKAQISATNKMAAQGLTRARKEIRDVYNIQLKYLTGKNSRGKTITQVEKTNSDIKPAKIVGYDAGLSLGKFKAKQVNTGVQVEVKKGSPKIIKHAFGPKIARLGKGVWQRVGKERTPIERKLGPGPATMLRSPKISKAVLDFVDHKFKSIMDHEIKYFLKIK